MPGALREVSPARPIDPSPERMAPGQRPDPMRILYDHQVFSLQNAGGASRYFYELMRSLAGTREVYTELWLGMHDTVYPFAQLPWAQTRVVGWKSRLRRGNLRYLANESLGNALALFAGKVEIYHPTLYRRMPLVRARRVVATHHDCVQERFPELFPDVRKIIRAKQNLYNRADAIICVSESSRHDLLRFYGVDRAKTRVIHHGLNRLPGSAQAAAELRQHVPGEYLLFVGSRAPYKNFDNLLRAFRATGLHKSLLLVAAGGGPLTPEERMLAEHLEVERQLLVLPQLSDTSLAEAYAAATLLIYPSWYEGFGFPPLEAMAAGCPALVSNTSCLPEVCLDAPFYFNPHEAGSLEQALVVAVSDEAARQRARERGTRVAARYSWNKCADQTLALYRECL
jgi:glycosyltransferase involved in cell wall biosynthesis